MGAWTHNLDLFPQKSKVKGGSKGRRGGRQRAQEKRGVEFENEGQTGRLGIKY